MGNQTEEDIKECSFKFHEFVTKVGDLTLSCHIIKMESCLYVWLGNLHENTMNDLSFAIASPSQELLDTRIMGSIDNEASSGLAKRLSKKLSKPVYVSFNIQADTLCMPAIEKKLRDEINSHPELH